MHKFRIEFTKGENPVSTAIQKVLFQHGFKWKDGSLAPYYFGDGVVTVNLVTRELSVFGPVGEILNPITNLTKILEYISKPCKSLVKLNDNHTAEVYIDKVVVGCQTFTHAAVKQLYMYSLAHQAGLPYGYTLLGFGGGFRIPKDVRGLSGKFLRPESTPPTWLDSSNLSWDDSSCIYAAKSDSPIVTLNNTK